jgi:hypothetical protein
VLEELLVLAPGVALALEGDVAPVLAPVADRREDVGRLRRAVRPEIQEDGLAGRLELEPLAARQPAVLPLPVLGEGEEGAVRLEEVDRLLQPVLELELELNRIGLQVDQPPGRRQLRIGLGAAVEVDQQVGRAV